MTRGKYRSETHVQVFLVFIFLIDIDFNLSNNERPVLNYNRLDVRRKIMKNFKRIKKSKNFEIYRSYQGLLKFHNVAVDNGKSLDLLRLKWQKGSIRG